MQSLVSEEIGTTLIPKIMDKLGHLFRIFAFPQYVFELIFVLHLSKLSNCKMAY